MSSCPICNLWSEARYKVTRLVSAIQLRCAGGEKVIQKTIEQCKESYSESGKAFKYFEKAESAMEDNWREHIWPMIQGADFSRVLEVAPGFGRNTEKLLEHAGEIYLVDVNEVCIEKCKERFKEYGGPCKLHFIVNDGRSLPGVPAGGITFVYSWDSMVHFDKLVVRDYVKEFARIMSPGATGFVHHSNFGDRSADSDWRSHPQWRSNMTAALFRQYCEEAGLRVCRQKTIDWGEKDLDCMSLFEKPAASAA